MKKFYRLCILRSATEAITRWIEEPKAQVGYRLFDDDTYWWIQAVGEARVPEMVAQQLDQLAVVA